MRIGLARETKDGEHRVALTPAGARQLRAAGHEVVVEPGAGAGVGFADADYGALGDPWDCPLVVKVKELQPPEYAKPRRGQVLFCFQHFGPDPELLDAALASGASFVAFETVGQADGSLPILAPMSALAGRLSIQVGAWCLQKQNGGSGVLLPGLEGVPPGRVAILGAGNVGANALAVAHGIGANVVVFSKSGRRAEALRARYPRTEFRTGTGALAEVLAETDLVVGGVLTPGEMSPKLVTRSMLAAMPRGIVVVGWWANAGPDGNFSENDIQLYGETLAHEVGHYVGMYHPVEWSYASWDALDDTDACTNMRDCEAALGGNNMFPYPICGPGGCRRQSDYTSDQGGVMLRYTGVR